MLRLCRTATRIHRDKTFGRSCTIENSLGNMLPALAISLLALGVLERDGVWVLAGFAAAVAGVSPVSGVMFAMVKATGYFFARVW